MYDVVRIRRYLRYKAGNEIKIIKLRTYVIKSIKFIKFIKCLNRLKMLKASSSYSTELLKIILQVYKTIKSGKFTSWLGVNHCAFNQLSA